MEHLDSRKNPLKDGLYRDREDEFYILYLFKQEEKWKFQIPESSETYNFPLDFCKDLVPVDDIVEEIKHFRDLKKNNIASFIEKKLDEEIEERRRLA